MTLYRDLQLLGQYERKIMEMEESVMEGKTDFLPRNS